MTVPVWPCEGLSHFSGDYPITGLELGQGSISLVTPHSVKEDFSASPAKMFDSNTGRQTQAHQKRHCQQSMMGKTYLDI